MSEQRRFKARVDDLEHDVEVPTADADTPSITVRVDGVPLEVLAAGDGRWRVVSPDGSGRTVTVLVGPSDDVARRYAWADHGAHAVVLESPQAAALEQLERQPGAQGGDGRVVSPMPGRVVKTLVEPGDGVDAGDSVVVVEAMKMENEVPTPVAGVVRRVLVEPGQAVDTGQALVEVDVHTETAP